MKRLYFMRHGLSEMNVQGLIAGVTDTPLTEEGRQQARQAGRAAQGMPLDAIVCSPLSRAHETARLFAEEYGFPPEKIVTNPLIIERNFGPFEGAPSGTSYDRDDEETDFEHDKKLLARAQEALDWINSLDAENILVVSHGSFGRALRSLLKADYPMSHPERLNNAELLVWVEEDE